MRNLIAMSAVFLLGAGNLFASHPQPYEMGRIQAVAHDLEEAARHVHRDAESRRHHDDRSESYALGRLHELEDEARHFHRQVERYRQNPYHTERDYLELREAYFRAAEALPALHGEGHVRRDFERVAYLMALLDRYYLDSRGRTDRRYRDDRYHHENRGRGSVWFGWWFHR